jgi:hypothetical protein
VTDPERCDHDHSDPKDPLFGASAILRDMADGTPLLHITLVHCPSLGDAELAAISGAMSRALADISAAATAAVAMGN